MLPADASERIEPVAASEPMDPAEAIDVERARSRTADLSDATRFAASTGASLLVHVVAVVDESAVGHLVDADTGDSSTVVVLGHPLAPGRRVAALDLQRLEHAAGRRNDLVHLGEESGDRLDPGERAEDRVLQDGVVGEQWRQCEIVAGVLHVPEL